MNKRPMMKYGDRIYARLSLNGQKILEFMIEKVSDFTELLGELRAHTRRYRGLCRLYVRNLSRGWSMERPLMLYPETYPTPGGALRERLSAAAPPAPAPARTIMPWDTH